MYLEYVFRLAKQYTTLGCIAALGAVLVMIFVCAIYFKFYKHEDARLPWTNFVAGGLFIFYLSIVVGATLLSRGQYTERMAQPILFETYKEAWYEADMVQWRNLVLNVLMFCPIGFLLPFTLKVFRNWWATYAFSFVCTLAIECTQYFFKCGVFQTDDLFNNFLGAMIGYGAFRVVIFLKNCILGRKKRVRATLLAQIPLLLTLCIFIGIAFKYNFQTYGNLEMEYMHKHDLNSVEVLFTPSEEKEEAYIYRVDTLSQDEMFARAKTIFWVTGKIISGTDCQYYDERATFYTENRSAAIWMDTQAGTYELQDYSQQKDSHGNAIPMRTDATEEELRQALQEYDIVLPDDATFTKDAEGMYVFSVDNGSETDEEDGLSGFVRGTYNCNGMFSYLQCNLKKMEKCEKIALRTQMEVAELIQEGKYEKIVTQDDIVLTPVGETNLQITGMTLDYAIDSKGYYRPYYCVAVTCNGLEGKIKISARA